MSKPRTGGIPEEGATPPDCPCWPVIKTELHEVTEIMFRKYYWVQPHEREDHEQNVMTYHILGNENERRIIHDLKPPKARRSRLYTITKNAYIDVLRALRGRERWAKEAYSDFERQDPRAHFPWEQMELEEFLDHALAAFSDRDRKLYYLRKIEQWLPKEICEELKIGRTTFYENRDSVDEEHLREVYRKEINP